MSNVDLSAVNRRENRLTAWLVTSILTNAALVVAVVGLASVLWDLRSKESSEAELLNARTPIIERIDAGTAQNECLAAISLRFEAGIIRTLAIPLEERSPAVDTLVAAASIIDEALTIGVDPCEIEIPRLVGDP